MVGTFIVGCRGGEKDLALTKRQVPLRSAKDGPSSRVVEIGDQYQLANGSWMVLDGLMPNCSGSVLFVRPLRSSIGVIRWRADGTFQYQRRPEE